MRGRRISLGLALAAAIAASVATSLASSPGRDDSRTPAGARGAAGHLVLALDTPATLPRAALTARRSSYVVLQVWETARAAELKAANPRLSVLAYQNLSAMAEGTNRDGLSSSGVNWAEADRAHPSWFLTEAGGRRIAESGYPYLWMADVGNVSYQRRWTTNVLQELRSGPWDGVFMDDTNTTARYHVDPVSRIARYPDDAAYQAAVRSMLAYAGPRITGAGLLAIPNIGSWAENPAVGEDWLRFVSGGMDQQFVKWSDLPGEGYASYPRWRVQLGEEQATERLGKRFLAVTHAGGGDRRAARYGWATALLGAGGHTAYLAGEGPGASVWLPQFEARIGRPLAPARRLANGLWSRRFAAGLVVVNPLTETLGIHFGRRYSGSGLHRARGATLFPHTGLVLTRAGR